MVKNAKLTRTTEWTSTTSAEPQAHVNATGSSFSRLCISSSSFFLSFEVSFTLLFSAAAARRYLISWSEAKIFEGRAAKSQTEKDRKRRVLRPSKIAAKVSGFYEAVEKANLST